MARNSLNANGPADLEIAYSKEYSFSALDLSSTDWSQIVLETTIASGASVPYIGATIRVNYAFSDTAGFISSAQLDSANYVDVPLDRDGGVTSSEPINVTGDYLYTWYSNSDILFDADTYLHDGGWQIQTDAVQYYAGMNGLPGTQSGAVQINWIAGQASIYSAVLISFTTPLTNYEFNWNFIPADQDSGSLALVKANKTTDGIQLLFLRTEGANGVVGTLDWQAVQVDDALSSATLIASSSTTFTPVYPVPPEQTYYVSGAGESQFDDTYTYVETIADSNAFGGSDPVWVYESSNNLGMMFAGIESSTAILALVGENPPEPHYVCDSNIASLGTWTVGANGVGPAPTVSIDPPVTVDNAIEATNAGNPFVNGTYYLKSSTAPVKNIYGTTDTFTCKAYHCETNGCWLISFIEPSYANRTDLFLSYPHSTSAPEYTWGTPNPLGETGSVGTGISTGAAPWLGGLSEQQPAAPTTNRVSLSLVNQTNLGDGSVFGANRTLLDGTTLFRLEGNTLSSHSVADVNDITNISSVTVANACNWMVMNDAKTHIYLGGTNGALYSYNVTNPASMSATGTVSAISNCSFGAWAKVHGNYIYAAFSYPGLGGAGGFVIYNISTAASPSLASETRFSDGNAGGGDVALFGNTLAVGKYLSHYQTDETFFALYDVTTKTAPTSVSQKIMCYDTEDDQGFPTFETWQMHEYGNYMILTDDFVWQVWDMTTPTSPKYLRSLYPPNSSDTEGGLITPDGVIVSGINGSTCLSTIVLGATPPTTASYDNQLVTAGGASSWYTYDSRGYVYGFIAGKLAVVSYTFT